MLEVWVKHHTERASSKSIHNHDRLLTMIQQLTIKTQLLPVPSDYPIGCEALCSLRNL